MVQEGIEATYSMGDDTPVAVLSELAPPIYNYFKQSFAQVTNPAIDPIRETVVMSSNVYLGRRSSLIGEPSQTQRLLSLEGPIILNEELDQIRNIGEIASKLYPDREKEYSPRRRGDRKDELFLATSENQTEECLAGSVLKINGDHDRVGDFTG